MSGFRIEDCADSFFLFQTSEQLHLAVNRTQQTLRAFQVNNACTLALQRLNQNRSNILSCQPQTSKGGIQQQHST